MTAFIKLHAAYPMGELLRPDPRWGATISAAVASIGCWAAGWLGVA